MFDRNEKAEELTKMIENGQFSQAIELVRSVKQYQDGELFVFVVLKAKDPTASEKLVEAVLEAFLATRENRYEKHGYWVHSLSHFTKHLWERRMVAWIKRFNDVAFKGANELHDPNCCDRLVGEFASHANWDDDPVAFGLTSDSLRWMKPNEYNEYSRARIESGKFASEEAFLRWKVRQPRTQFSFDFDAQMDLVNIAGIRQIIGRLQELGADVSEFSDLMESLLTTQLAKLETELPTAREDWRVERIKKGIEKTRAALAR